MTTVSTIVIVFDIGVVVVVETVVICMIIRPSHVFQVENVSESIFLMSRRGRYVRRRGKVKIHCRSKKRRRTRRRRTRRREERKMKMKYAKIRFMK